MFLKKDDNLIQIESMEELMNPMTDTVSGHSHYGEEIQDKESFSKSDLVFPSGEKLPQCWTDSEYRKQEQIQKQSAG